MSGTWLRPLFRSAWPSADIDDLLRIALADDAGAAEAWARFEARANLDHLAPGENRLIGLVARRLPTVAPDSAMRPRIAGIERANWSRAQLTIAESGAALRVLAAGGVEMMLIKGASRVASGDLLGRGRALNDIDIVARPRDMVRAYDLLVADGWQPAGSGSAAFQRKYLTTSMGLNLVRGRFGNLDLHQSAFHPFHASPADDEGVWRRARPGSLSGVAVQLPSATDALAIAIAHGSLDSHRSSDWLADAAIAINTGIDWDLFAEIAAKRRLRAAAAIALLYARERLNRPVPDEFLDTLEAAAARQPLQSLAAVVESRPKAGRVGVSWAVRGVVKHTRMWRHPDDAAPSPVAAVPLLLRKGAPDDEQSRQLEHPLDLPGRAPAAPWQGTVAVTLSVPPQKTWRRLDFEIHVGGEPRLRLRARPWRRGRGAFRFRFPLMLGAGEPTPVLIAAPSRGFNTNAPADVLDRYRAVPFTLLRLSASPAPAPPS